MRKEHRNVCPAILWSDFTTHVWREEEACVQACSCTDGAKAATGPLGESLPRVAEIFEAVITLFVCGGPSKTFWRLDLAMFLRRTGGSPLKVSSTSPGGV